MEADRNNPGILEYAVVTFCKSRQTAMTRTKMEREIDINVTTSNIVIYRWIILKKLETLPVKGGLDYV